MSDLGSEMPWQLARPHHRCESGIERFAPIVREYHRRGERGRLLRQGQKLSSSKQAALRGWPLSLTPFRAPWKVQSPGPRYDSQTKRGKKTARPQAAAVGSANCNTPLCRHRSANRQDQALLGPGFQKGVHSLALVAAARSEERRVGK